MKRLPLLLAVLLLVLLAGCGDDLPPDYVKGNKIVIDNETPFVYPFTDLQPTAYPQGYPYTYSPSAILFMYHPEGEPVRHYSAFARYCGNKILRACTTEEIADYYTVYAELDNGLTYVFLNKGEDGTLLIDRERSGPADARSVLDGIQKQDQPAVILGARLPIKYQKEYYSFDEVARRTENVWQEYSHYCASADLPSHFEYLYDPEISEFWRCMQSVSFDVTDKDSRRAADGLYVYDLIRYKDGRNVLHFRHLTDWSYPRHELVQEEILPLSDEEAKAIFTVLEEANVSDIPTWNPEESSGFDGETTYVLNPHEHLIGMWCATEHHSIYHIREAFEEIVRNRITVTSGRIFEQPK